MYYDLQFNKIKIYYLLHIKMGIYLFSKINNRNE